MDEKLKRFIKAFGKLNVDRTHGRAPHKPILLLAVLQAYRNGFIQNNRIYMTPELVALFKTKWSSLVTTNHECRISYPFYYLKSDKFWKLVPKVGFEDVNQMGSIMKTFTNLMKAIDYALIDEDLMILALDQKSNLMLQQFLLDEYFPETKVNYSDMLSNDNSVFNRIEEKILNEPPEEYKEEIKKIMAEKDEEEIFLRGSLFKREIPKIYHNTCCITGMQIHTTVSTSMIDACH
ncbi:MAG: HNH endonuclease, partial [Bacteroidota bacterium]